MIDQATVILKGRGMNPGLVMAPRIRATWRAAFQVLWTAHGTHVESNGRHTDHQKWITLKKVVVKDLAVSTRDYIIALDEKTLGCKSAQDATNARSRDVALKSLPQVDILNFKTFITQHDDLQHGGNLHFKPTYRHCLDALRDGLEDESIDYMKLRDLLGMVLKQADTVMPQEWVTPLEPR